MSAPPDESTPTARTAGALGCFGVVANASNRFAPTAQSDKPSVGLLEGRKHKVADETKLVRFQAPDGRCWGFGGKAGRVLAMLATKLAGMTQYDTLPWHTRLGASIHSLRKAGLDIVTEREGPCRHARYKLRTPGTLIEQVPA